jgi:hypothetical protein
MDTPSSTVIIQYNNIHDNYYGIEAAANTLSYAHYNNIYNNREYGVISASDYLGNNAPFDARYNWWGHETGPYHGTSWTYMGSPYGPHYGLGDNVSDYVLYNPWLKTPFTPPPIHDVAILSVVPSATRVAIGTTIQVNVTAKNEGNTYETFDVSLYYNGNFISTQTITDLAPGTTKQLTFYWDTTGTTPGTDYTITAVASTVPGETDTADNAKSAIDKVRVGKAALIKATSYKANLLNQTVAINITLNDLEAYWRVIAVQFRLCYNNTLLEFINVTEGPLLKRYASLQPGCPGTFFIYIDEDDMLYGHNVIVGTIILPNGTGCWNPPFPEGNETIATIYFKAVYQERGTEKPPSSCDLVLVETDIFDDDGETIPYIVQDGSYWIPPTHVGDFNYDGRVDMDDVYRCAKAFGETPGRPRWDPDVDINRDGRIDMADLYICCKAFGWRMGDP